MPVPYPRAHLSTCLDLLSAAVREVFAYKLSEKGRVNDHVAPVPSPPQSFMTPFENSGVTIVHPASQPHLHEVAYSTLSAADYIG